MTTVLHDREVAIQNTIPRVTTATGYNSVTIALLTPVSVVNSTSAGVVTTLPQTNKVTLYVGGVAVTSDVVYGPVSVSQNSLTLSVSPNTGNITLSQGTWTSTDQETFNITALYNNITYTTQYTISKAKDGVAGGGFNAISAILTNESSVVPANAAGVVPSGGFAGAVTTLKVYNGAADDTSNWTISVVKTNVTCSEATNSPTQSVTAMSADIGYIDFTATRATYDNISKRFIITKAKTGDTGASSTAYWLLLNTPVIRKNISNIFSPATIITTGMSATGGTTPSTYAARFKIYENGSGTASYTSTVNEISTTYTPSSSSVFSIQVEMYLAGGTTTLVDRQSVIVVSDGVPGTPGTDGAPGDDGAPGADANKTAIVQLWQWATNTPGSPTGSTQYTWSTVTNATPLGILNNWQLSVPANPGTPGLKLWVASKSITDVASQTVTPVYWNTEVNIAAWSANGSTGPAGTSAVNSAQPTVYKWAATIPTAPSGTPTYTWATASFGTAPANWFLEPPETSPSPGYTLWAATVYFTDAATSPTTNFDWTSSSITARGYAGTQGATGATGPQGSTGPTGPSGSGGNSARIAYALVTGYSLNSTPDNIVSAGSLPPNGSWGAATWQAFPPASYSQGQSVFQANGIYVPETGLTTWGLPYLSNLKVGNLSAISANTGQLTVTGDIFVSSGALLGGGYTSSAWPISTGIMGFYLGPNGIKLGNTIDNRYFQVTNTGNVYAPGFSIVDGIATFSQLNISSSGILSGGGGGQVTALGLGAVRTDLTNAPPEIQNSYSVIGQNLFPNSDFTASHTWTTGYNPNGALITVLPRYAEGYSSWNTTNYVLNAGITKNLFSYQSGILAGGDAQIAVDLVTTSASRMACVSGQRLVGSVYVAGHRCNFAALLVFFSKTGVQSSVTGTTFLATDTATNALTAYRRAYVLATAPADVAYCELRIRKYNTKIGGTDSYIWWAAPQVETVNSNVSTPSPYTSGPNVLLEHLGYVGDPDATNGAPVGTLVAGSAAVDVATGAANGAAAYTGTATFRTTGAPTNNPSGITASYLQTADGNVIATINYSYTQGTKPADALLVYFKESGGTITNSSPCIATGPSTGSIKIAVKPGTTYRFGVSASRLAADGYFEGSIIQTADSVASASNFTGSINGTTTAVLLDNATNGNTAYNETVEFRAANVPTNNPTSVSAAFSSTADGNVLVTVSYTYAQGTRTADSLVVYYKESGGTITSASPSYVTNPYTGSITFTVKPATVYRFGVAAGRTTAAGYYEGSIVHTTANQTSLGSNFTGAIDGNTASTVISNATNGSTAYSQTVAFRTNSAPTNSPTSVSWSYSNSSDGNILATISYSYAQGTNQADALLVYYKEGGGTITTATPSIATNPVSGSITLIVKPSTVYRFGVSATRVAAGGYYPGAIVSTVDTTGSPAANFTGNINGNSSAAIVAAASDALKASERKILSGGGGIAVGTMNWDAAGTVNSGYGVAITNKGITARSSAVGNPVTFTLDGTNGNATFAGILSGTVVKAGNIEIGAVSQAVNTSIMGRSQVASNTFIVGDSTPYLVFNMTSSGQPINISGTMNINCQVNTTDPYFFQIHCRLFIDGIERHTVSIDQVLPIYVNGVARFMRSIPISARLAVASGSHQYQLYTTVSTKDFYGNSVSVPYIQLWTDINYTAQENKV